MLDWLSIGDYGWNSFCCFMMLATNRRLLKHAFVCSQKNEKTKKTQSHAGMISFYCSLKFFVVLPRAKI